MRVMSEKGHADEHPIDRQYTSLKCQMTPLDKEVAEYKVRNRQTDQQTDRLTDRQTDEQTKYKQMCLCLAC